eukprot:CAMPEP_0170187664 /NCGR_PEP_ID=MMETSP0040_2-20121228/42287_1 /TAXON_ID=641309 /ORGANISM="Lotharella oceanica, Strain CCMP622" /LENGTH=58 /DNA_ID=CAMNT_0010434755 /DNA_START=5 /DNA_END=177 /DNA_ORIENTATION=+
MGDLHLDLKVTLFHLEVHPSKEVVAVGTIEGKVWLGAVGDSGINALTKEEEEEGGGGG